MKSHSSYSSPVCGTWSTSIVATAIKSSHSCRSKAINQKLNSQVHYIRDGYAMGEKHYCRTG